MLPELPKLEKSRLCAGFFRIFTVNLTILNLALNFTLMTLTPIAEAQVPGMERAAGMISGTVLSLADNRPVGQVAVILKSDSAGISRSVLTDYDGRFDVTDLPIGTYEILVEEVGYESVRTKERLEGPSLKIVLHLNECKPSLARRNGDSISVRELKIPGKARHEFRKGSESMVKRDFAGSLRHFKNAIQAFPDYYEAYFCTGSVEMKLGHQEEAMQAFQKAVDISGGRYAWAQFAIGNLLYLQGKLGEAETVIRRGLDADADLPDGYVILGILLVHQNRLDEAERNAREALLRNPNFADAYLVLSDVYARRREFAAQLQHLDAYLKLDPTGPASARVQQARKTILGMIAKAQPQD